MLIDTHCHLNTEDYDNLDTVISNMKGIMIASGCNDKTNKEILELVEKYDNVYGTLGIHPEEIDTVTQDSFKLIEANLNNPKIVAIGEIGLDYHFNSTNKNEQQDLLNKQLILAEKYNKPVVIHSRDAIQDTYDILKKYNIKGTIHCFSSSLEMAREFIKLGYKIGIGGVVTFKNGKKLQDIVKNISLNDILLETDSPYLSPEPNRGKQNEPTNTYFVAQKIAEIKGTNIDEVIDVTSKNAMGLFDLKVK